jgi:hypothetical protein
MVTSGLGTGAQQTSESYGACVMVKAKRCHRTSPFPGSPFLPPPFPAPPSPAQQSDGQDAATAGLARVRKFAVKTVERVLAMVGPSAQTNLRLALRGRQ